MQSNKVYNMEWLNISTNNEIIRIPTEEIVFIKGDGNYSDVFLQNGKKENVLAQLHSLEEKLFSIKDCTFFRVGKSFIINKNFIYKVNPGVQKLILASSKLAGDIHLKLSKEALKELKAKLEKEGGNS